MLKQGPDFQFEISEVEITRVDCISQIFTNEAVDRYADRPFEQHQNEGKVLLM